VLILKWLRDQEIFFNKFLKSTLKTCERKCFSECIAAPYIFIHFVLRAIWENFFFLYFLFYFMMEHMFQVLWNNYVVNIYYLFFFASFLVVPYSCCMLYTKIKLKFHWKTAQRKVFMTLLVILFIFTVALWVFFSWNLNLLFLQC